MKRNYRLYTIILAVTAFLGILIYFYIPKTDIIEYEGVSIKVPFKVENIQDIKGITGPSGKMFADNSRNNHQIEIWKQNNFTEADYESIRNTYENLDDTYCYRDFVELRKVSEYHIKNGSSYKCIITYLDAGPVLYGGLLYEPIKNQAYHMRFTGLSLQEIIKIMDNVTFLKTEN